MPRFTVDTFHYAVPDLRESLAREIGAGDTLLSALQDFATIGWEDEPDVLLRTVVWVRDDAGRIVGTGHYRKPKDLIPFDPYYQEGYPVLEIHNPSLDQVYRFRRFPRGDSYTAEMTRRSVEWDAMP